MRNLILKPLSAIKQQDVSHQSIYHPSKKRRIGFRKGTSYAVIYPYNAKAGGHKGVTTHKCMDSLINRVTRIMHNTQGLAKICVVNDGGEIYEILEADDHGEMRYPSKRYELAKTGDFVHIEDADYELNPDASIEPTTS